MIQGHPRPGVTHHLSDTSPHLGLITVNRTVAAGGFSFPIRALSDPLFGVCGKFPAPVAQILRPVMAAAVNTDHQPERVDLSVQ
jgi:hypothetical protein